MTFLMPSQTQQSQAASSQDFTGKADQHVPTFNNVQSEYKEFKRRCDIYAAKMKIAKRSNETVYNIMTLLTGRAWDCVEDLQVSDLAKENAYDVVMDRLDKAFKYEALTELPQDFENFFIKMQRKAGQTVQDFETEYLHLERKLINLHKIDIPEKIRAWWFLRRAGLTREQRQLILTQLGESNLTLDRAMKAMNFIIGQDSKLDGGRQPRHYGGNYKAISYAADDQEGYDDDEVYWNEEEDEQDQVDWSEEYYDQTYAATDEPDHDDAYDVHEYDDVFASYVEAKSQLNRMRTSRGYYPVVAMVQGPVVGGSERKGPSKGKVVENPRASMVEERVEAVLPRKAVRSIELKMHLVVKFVFVVEDLAIGPGIALFSLEPVRRRERLMMISRISKWWQRW